mmetsp:Transcript_10745/g.37615  ORF Transcript_10745/g.37615 Transcript_10745/m.37615 type:complete len:239 (-) Transcript_10745:320-1036(-)
MPIARDMLLPLPASFADCAWAACISKSVLPLLPRKQGGILDSFRAAPASMVAYSSREASASASGLAHFLHQAQTNIVPKMKHNPPTPMMLMFLASSPMRMRSGSICAAEKDMEPNSLSPTCGRASASSAKESRHTTGPSLRSAFTSKPAICKPHFFTKGAVVPKLERPKETLTPTSNCSSKNNGISASERKREIQELERSAAISASMLMLMVPFPPSGRVEPSIKVSMPMVTARSIPT